VRPRDEQGEPLLTEQELRRVFAVINADLSGRLTGSRLGEVVSLTERYFAGAFLRTIGMSPHRWVTRQRCIEAAGMLANGAVIEDVYWRVGFCSQSHFTQVFRKQLGKTPGQYRREMGTNNV
jgi:AraC family transcriptional regulator